MLYDIMFYINYILQWALNCHFLGLNFQTRTLEVLETHEIDFYFTVDFVENKRHQVGTPRNASKYVVKNTLHEHQWSE